jgi:hypothetical protein
MKTLSGTERENFQETRIAGWIAHCEPGGHTCFGEERSQSGKIPLQNPAASGASEIWRSPRGLIEPEVCQSDPPGKIGPNNRAFHLSLPRPPVISNSAADQQAPRPRAQPGHRPHAAQLKA